MKSQERRHFANRNAPYPCTNINTWNQSRPITTPIPTAVDQSDCKVQRPRSFLSHDLSSKRPLPDISTSQNSTRSSRPTSLSHSCEYRKPPSLEGCGWVDSLGWVGNWMDAWMAPHMKGTLNDMLRNIDFS